MEIQDVVMFIIIDIPLFQIDRKLFDIDTYQFYKDIYH